MHLKTVEIKESVIRDNKHCGLYVSSPEAQVRGTPNEMRGNGADLCGYAPAALRKPRVSQTNRAFLMVPGDFGDLQEAVDAIFPGGTITMASGTYKTGLTLWKPLTLEGMSGPAVMPTKLIELPERSLIISVIAGVQGVVLDGLEIQGTYGEGGAHLRASHHPRHDSLRSQVGDQREGFSMGNPGWKGPAMPDGQVCLL